MVTWNSVCYPFFGNFTERLKCTNYVPSEEYTDDEDEDDN